MADRIGIQITPNDNVVTVVEEALPGDTVRYMTPEGHREIAALEAIPFGHKVAVRDIRPGERVVKYDEAIGTASRLVRGGEHVHAHNVRSTVQGSTK